VIVEGISSEKLYYVSGKQMVPKYFAEKQNVHQPIYHFIFNHCYEKIKLVKRKAVTFALEWSQCWLANLKIASST